jgi:hypothetical protein
MKKDMTDFELSDFSYKSSFNCVKSYHTTKKFNSFLIFSHHSFLQARPTLPGSSGREKSAAKGPYKFVVHGQGTEVLPSSNNEYHYSARSGLIGPNRLLLTPSPYV